MLGMQFNQLTSLMDERLGDTADWRASLYCRSLALQYMSFNLAARHAINPLHAALPPIPTSFTNWFYMKTIISSKKGLGEFNLLFYFLGTINLQVYGVVLRRGPIQKSCQISPSNEGNDCLLISIENHLKHVYQRKEDFDSDIDEICMI